MQTVENHLQKYALKVTFAKFSNFVKTLQLHCVHATDVYRAAWYISQPLHKHTVSNFV